MGIALTKATRIPNEMNSVVWVHTLLVYEGDM